jgi:hypothetical protein
MMIASLMPQCPMTARAVYAELDASPRTWDALVLAPRTLGCAACGQPHQWTKADVWLAPAPPPAALAADGGPA